MSNIKVSKPCRKLGFCPYGALVEDMPVLKCTRAEALKWLAHVKQQVKLPGWEHLQVRIDEFNLDDYPEVIPNIERYCKEYGHLCPVFICAESSVDGGE